MKHLPGTALILSFLILSGSSIFAEERAWTSSSGSTILGEMASRTDDTVTIRRKLGAEITVKLSELSREDQTFVKEWVHPLDKGLIFHADFDDKTADDKSGKGKDGILTGTTTGPSVDKKEGFSRQFDGEDDVIRLPMDFNPSTHPKLTITVWAKPSKDMKMGKIFSQDNGGYDRTIGVDKRGDSDVGEFQWVAFCGNGRVLGSEPIKGRSWVFLAVVYDQNSEQVTLYVDKKKYSKRGLMGQGHNFANIGSNPSYGAFFEGNLDDLRIYNRALTEDEVEALRKR